MTKLDEDSFSKGRVLANNLKAVGYFIAAAALACVTAFSTGKAFEEFDDKFNNVDHHESTDRNVQLKDGEQGLSSPESDSALYSLGSVGSASLTLIFFLFSDMHRKRAVDYKKGDSTHKPSSLEDDKPENDIS